ncbi:MAG: DUF4231 domain-containing protein [Saprospiraceae bacterium]|nr:DUF4231 domain-containing protein [Saprospiraceae bacterium]
MAAPTNDSDPIQMLRDYLNDNPNTPGFFRNFLINRLGDQILWYDNKSRNFKRRWERYRKVIIILSASIPFLVGLIGEKSMEGAPAFWLKMFIGLSGVLIAVLEGFNSLLKNQDLYVEYRATAEQLRQEFSYFLGQAGDYSDGGDAAYSKLVAKAETILASQNNRWTEAARQNERAAMSENIEAFVQEYLRKKGFQMPANTEEQPPASEDSSADSANSDAPPAPEPPKV